MCLDPLTLSSCPNKINEDIIKRGEEIGERWRVMGEV